MKIEKQTGKDLVQRSPGRTRTTGMLVYFAAIGLLFSGALASLVTHAVTNELHSHTLLIPFVSLYLVYLRRSADRESSGASPIAGGVLLAMGIGGLVASWVSPVIQQFSRNDLVSWQTAAFLLCVLAGGFFFRGGAWMRAHAFPSGFLVFAIPLPDRMVEALETTFKLASAEAAALLFTVSGVPVFREGLVFQLPGITLEVAQECSGIRSTWVLLITASLCTYLFLNTTWRRALVIALIIPLGILRNGFRIVVLGWLCANFGPAWIDSAIHHHGGPLFFVLSLIPLVLLLGWLRANERRSNPGLSSESNSGTVIRAGTA